MAITIVDQTSAGGGGGSTSDITNASSVAGATATDALNNNKSGIDGNTTDIATNTSDIATNETNITNNTASIATNASNIATNTSNIATNTADIAALGSDDIGNDSTVSGATVSAALNNLAAGGGGGALVKRSIQRKATRATSAGFLYMSKSITPAAGSNEIWVTIVVTAMANAGTQQELTLKQGLSGLRTFVLDFDTAEPKNFVLQHRYNNSGTSALSFVVDFDTNPSGFVINPNGTDGIGGLAPQQESYLILDEISET